MKWDASIFNWPTNENESVGWNCKITSGVPYGVFVEIVPGREGLCHVNELSPDWLSKPEVTSGAAVVVFARDCQLRDAENPILTIALVLVAGRRCHFQLSRPTTPRRIRNNKPLCSSEKQIVNILKEMLVKALVKDKRAPMESFGTYVEEGFPSKVETL
ncbi:hypothetical protein L1987_18613 [Smallanthus sonchifolius]|uniref:Uncharacterized protein n=1 Tax=Smallanthus sonchifolius TaxID=185202 RepID=A0ACB9J084_9ASTR|nr:hypothetical protein L1987_18613 [Smallanthus sonchifolius]